MNFSAVILAGGKSSRMGSDKAFAEIAGQTLLARQIQLVRAAGGTEVFISGRPDADYSTFGAPVLTDKFPDAGPLAGIHSALESMTSPLLLVLAVDLAAMTSEFLRSLVVGCREQIGIVPRLGGNLEPLAALYPQAALPLVTSLLQQNSLTVKNFVRQCEQSDLVTLADQPDSFAKYFLNCNSPAELEAFRGH